MLADVQVFLSYASEDSEKARRIAEHLRSEGLEVWDAGTEILPGDNAGNAIGKALESSDAMVVLVSPASSKSSNVQHEIDFALQRKQYARRLIPVVVEPTEKMPWILRKLQLVDLGQEGDAGLRKIVSSLKSA